MPGSIAATIFAPCLRNLAGVHFCLAVGCVLTTVIRKRLEANRITWATYTVTDGGLNSVWVTLDAQLSGAERRRILLGYGAVLLTHVPAFDPNSVSNASPVPLTAFGGSQWA